MTGKEWQSMLKCEHEAWYRKAVPTNDELEVPIDAVVSKGYDGDGAFVQAWVWVCTPTCDECGEYVTECACVETEEAPKAGEVGGSRSPTDGQEAH